MNLFELEYPEGNTQIDDTTILTTLLYFSEQEMKLFKKLCKKGIRAEYGAEAATKGNISDLLIKILTERYGDL